MKKFILIFLITRFIFLNFKIGYNTIIIDILNIYSHFIYGARYYIRYATRAYFFVSNCHRFYYNIMDVL
jgi:hypothetical protein